MENHLSLIESSIKLGKSSKEFMSMFTHGSLEVELYKPNKVDKQQPHSRDEVYVIASGTSLFLLEEKSLQVEKGDFLFVPARAEHKFVDFSDNFSTWVLFYGPEGGERSEDI